MVNKIKQKVLPYQKPFDLHFYLRGKHVIASSCTQNTPRKIRNWLDVGLVNPRDERHLSITIAYLVRRRFKLSHILNDLRKNHDVTRTVIPKGDECVMILSCVDRYDEPTYRVLRARLFPEIKLSS